MAALTRAALLTLAALASVSIAPMSAQTPAAATVPPVIDRELFFGNPEIAGAQLSPDGSSHRLHQAVQGHAATSG